MLNDVCAKVCTRRTSTETIVTMIRMEYIEDAFTSCSTGLDHPSSKLNMCLDTWLCGWLCTISSSNGS